ncbi:MAG: sodium:calcium antiporter, partial [Rhodospirillales bacterium]|nr:sodium:calcium antiporter [Rhodospirillales bacterium]
MMYLQIAIGFMLLLGGAEFLVRGAVSMARRLGISPLVIGMVVVGFGTSAPELVVTLDAAMSG